MVWRPRKKRRTLPKWAPVEVSLGPDTHRGRYRMEGEQVVLEWREGRVSEPCGLVRPDVLAAYRLRLLVSGIEFPDPSAASGRITGRKRPIA